jgi:uncharacterized membrane protein YccC
MEVLKNMLVGLLAGDMALWSLVVIVALVAWVVADAAILARGMQTKHSCDDDWLHDQSRWDRSDDDSTDRSSMFGGLLGHGTDSDGTSRM